MSARDERAATATLGTSYSSSRRAMLLDGFVHSFLA
jgi:hypothetical protein